MRKFKFLGKNEDYRWYINPDLNIIYTEFDLAKMFGSGWFSIGYNLEAKDWQEVLENQSPWISVSDRLPEVEIDILIFDGKDLYIGYLRGNKFLSDNEYLYSSNVTHWMPLPEPPVK